jgi:hypothetical protein
MQADILVERDGAGGYRVDIAGPAGAISTR